jgi:hypothetical protein
VVQLAQICRIDLELVEKSMANHVCHNVWNRKEPDPCHVEALEHLAMPRSSPPTLEKLRLDYPLFVQAAPPFLEYSFHVEQHQEVSQAEDVPNHYFDPTPISTNCLGEHQSIEWFEEINGALEGLTNHLFIAILASTLLSFNQHISLQTGRAS